MSITPKICFHTLCIYIADHHRPQFKKSVHMSPEERTFMCHLIALDSLSPRQTVLYEAAERLYCEKTIKQLEPRLCSDGCPDGTVLKEKALSQLRRSMENSHYSITQLAFNMGKLAGMICYKWIKPQCCQCQRQN